jgi:hypothetical protein
MPSLGGLKEPVLGLTDGRRKIIEINNSQATVERCSGSSGERTSGNRGEDGVTWRSS